MYPLTNSRNKSLQEFRHINNPFTISSSNNIHLFNCSRNVAYTKFIQRGGIGRERVYWRYLNLLVLCNITGKRIITQLYPRAGDNLVFFFISLNLKEIKAILFIANNGKPIFAHFSYSAIICGRNPKLM